MAKGAISEQYSQDSESLIFKRTYKDQTFCKVCGAMAEEGNPKCPMCGSAEIGQKISDMTLEEQEHAQEMMKYDKCPKCGKIKLKSASLCDDCDPNKNPLLKKLPEWMTDKTATTVLYICNDCYEYFYENTTCCPKCHSKNVAIMTDEDKKSAYKQAKTDKGYACQLVLFWIIWLSFAYFALWCLGLDGLDLAGNSFIVAMFGFMLEGSFYSKQYAAGLFGKAKAHYIVQFKIVLPFLIFSMVLGLIYDLFGQFSVINQHS